jgi:ornithine carbamoyltransferase
MPNFIDLDKIEASELRKIIDLAHDLKAKRSNLKLGGKQLAMIFEKSSTRTRISFEVGINQLGGDAIVMNKSDTQLGKGETISDTAKVLSRFVDLAMLRVDKHETLLEMAKNATIPVINALSDFSHPCQIMASVMAIEEHLGAIKGKKLAWFGDANNVLNSYIHGALAFDYELRIAIPEGYDFCDAEIEKAKKNGAKIIVCKSAKEAAIGANVLIADTWISMGQVSEGDEKKRKQKIAQLMPFQVTQELMDLADSNAIFTHCLPAYRGFEVSEEVLDGPKSIVFDEAENRLHAQKAVMLWCCQKNL